MVFIIFYFLVKRIHDQNKIYANILCEKDGNHANEKKIQKKPKKKINLSTFVEMFMSNEMQSIQKYIAKTIESYHLMKNILLEPDLHM